jgi:putative sigma-54 modulation protein
VKAWAQAEMNKVGARRQRKTKAIRRRAMNLTISGHHLEVTPALRSYVTQKLDRVTRHFDQVVDVKVLLTVEKQKEKDKRQRAECNIHVKGNDMFAESAHEDLYACLLYTSDAADDPHRV